VNEADQLEEARALFKSFQFREPRIGTDDVISISGLRIPTVGLMIGHMVEIGYKALGDGVYYKHQFSDFSRPLVYVNSDGRQIYILKGGYRFSDRGFIG
jgi:hypothetical protein